MNSILRLIRACTSGFALAICVIAGANAAPACIDPGGIGGTGSPALSGGIGGTGAPARSGGVGGTGAPAIGHGIGGTGAPMAATPGGIGGTGARIADNGLGGTGIVGTITGFASICVNGVEVHFDDDVPVSMNESPALLGQLAVGQVVAVEAGLSARGLEATRISILNAFEGPLTALPTATEPMRVMGQPVRVAENAQLSNALQLGQMVRVSGLRNASGEVVATRVERAPDQIEASAIGTIDPRGSLQGLILGSTQAVPGGEVLVRGKWSGTTLNVVRTSPDPSIPFGGRVREAIVEGLVHDRAGSKVTISGFSVNFASGTQFADGERNTLNKDQRIRVHGVFTGSREITASRIEFVRPDRGSNGAVRGNTSKSDGEDGGGGEGREDKNGNSKSESRTKVDDDGGEKKKIETRDQSYRQKIELELTSDGHIERERIESRTEGPDGNLERRERIEVRESNGVIETRERIEIFVDGERVQRIERRDRVESPDRVDRPDTIERLEKLERLEKVERPETVERVEKIERPEKVERVEKIERPEKVERAEKIERPEKVERLRRDD